MTLKTPYIARMISDSMVLSSGPLFRAYRVVLTAKGNMKYDDNIKILDLNPSDQVELKESEYYALMVVDRVTPIELREWFDASKRFVGLERTSGYIYISKRYEKRENYHRGWTVLVLVKDPNLCCLLI